MSTYRKAIAALLGSIGTWGMTAAAEGGITGAEWFGLLAVLGTTSAVWGLPNDTDPGEDGAIEPGSLALGIVLGVVLALLIWGADR